MVSDRLPKVDVFLSSYNHVDFLRESIDSILQQSYRDFVLTIVDDGSTDGSQDVIRSYDDPRIKKILLEENTGCGYYQDVLSSMTAKYVAIAHCDDRWMPDKLEKQVAFLDAHPDVAACFTQVQVIDEEGKPLEDEKHVYYSMFQQENRSRFEWLRFFFDKGNCLCHPSVLIRKDAYLQYGLFTNGLSGIPDFIQWVRLCHHAEIWIYPEMLSCFRVRKNEQNTSGDAAEKHYRNFIEQYLTLGEYVDFNCAEEFLKIFPECQKYQIDGDILLEYAYARVLLEREHSPAKHLYAYQLLYNLMQTSESRQKLETLYGYTQRMFEKEKQREDIFSLIPASSFMDAVLYYDVGNGFDEQHCLRQRVYITHEEKFFVRFQLPQFSENVKSLRFDPDCNFWRICRNLRVKVNGVSETVSALGAIRQENWDVFETLDSQYLIKLHQEIVGLAWIEIEGECRQFSAYQKEKYWIERNMEQEKTIAVLQEKLTVQSQQKQSLEQKSKCDREHIEQLEKEILRLNDSMRNHPVKTALHILLKKI